MPENLVRLPRYDLDLVIPGFEQAVPRGSVVQHSYVDRDIAAWYRAFVERLQSSWGTYLPVVRFGDGECSFVVGYRPPRMPSEVQRRARWLKTVISAYGKHRLHRRFRSGSRGYGYEIYEREELLTLRPRFDAAMERIASAGLIGVNFVTQFGEPFCQQYVGPVSRWFAARGIDVETALFPCYFVYAAFLGSAGRQILDGKDVLIVNSADGAMRDRIVAGVRQEGARDVRWLPVSRQKAMADRIDIASVNGRPDIVLVGAGVGAANVLDSLSGLACPIIDVGYVLDCYADPDLRGSRVFTAGNDSSGLSQGSARRRERPRL